MPGIPGITTAGLHLPPSPAAVAVVAALAVVDAITAPVALTAAVITAAASIADNFLFMV
jgi:hypothetical protein